ncbi:MAG: helix-turn-helix domain-containing protein [Alphaproteobacteria bacterium]|jgi:transcriptional regulator with XRE-family HTH domain|nr:helix-turn-helix domain-containing protein [Alphaproteobacteria bacterium]
MLDLYKMNSSIKFQIKNGLIREENWMLGRRIRFARKQIRKTQEEFAKILNISKSTLQNYESGKQNAATNTLQQIIKDFNINSNWLLMNKGEMIGKEINENIEEKNFSTNDLLLETFAELYSKTLEKYKNLNLEPPKDIKEKTINKTKNILNITQDKENINKMIEITLENELN